MTDPSERLRQLHIAFILAAENPLHPLREWCTKYEAQQYRLALATALAAPAQVHQLRPPTAEGVVPFLTELLRRAQAGEVESVALAWLGQHPNYGVWFSDAPGLAMVGAVTDLQHTLLRRLNGLQVGGVPE